MLGKGVSGEHFRPRTCSGKNTVKTREGKGNLKNIVYIDVDNDQVDDVVIIDYPEFVSQKLNGSSGPSRDRTWTPQSVISIDDDDDDESDDVDHPGVDAGGAGELDSDASSSKRFSSASSSVQNSVHIDVDDCDVCEKDSVSNKQKSKEDCSAKAADRNRYGLYGSEGESSDSDCSDCELMEREQWEKFSTKRKRHVFNDQSCHDEHASSSGLHSKNYVDIKVENRSEQHAEVPVYSGPSNVETEHCFKDSGKKVEQENFKSPRSESIKGMHSFRQSSDTGHGERTNREKITPCPKDKNCNFCSGVTGASRFEQHAEGPVYSGPSNDKYAKENQSSFPAKDGSQGDGIYFNVETENSFKDSGKKVEKENFKSSRSESIKEMHSFFRSSDIGHGERTSREKITPCPSDKNCNFCSGVTGASRFKKDLGAEESKFMGLNPDAYDRQVHNDGSALRSEDDNIPEVNSNCASFDERDGNGDGFVVRAQDGGLSASNGNDFINEREKLKETDEYKQAMEEEWASRQRQLQIQAEEAQRLRKRKKAESKRLLDMQRRQQERIEEVRETQKKDEEFLNMKEKLRVEIRKGLKELEMRCKDMPSLLRGLGIHVGGSLIPLPNEVQAAYKRALFKFHPDRASKTDIRQQVEAEEKFKLISRMKEKFLLTSCH